MKIYILKSGNFIENYYGCRNAAEKRINELNDWIKEHSGHPNLDETPYEIEEAEVNTL